MGRVCTLQTPVILISRRYRDSCIGLGVSVPVVLSKQIPISSVGVAIGDTQYDNLHKKQVDNTQQ